MLQALRSFGVHHQHVGHPHHLGDGRKVGGGVVGHLLEEPGVDCVGGGGGNADGAAVRRGLGHQVRADVAACTRFVVDDDGTEAVS